VAAKGEGVAVGGTLSGGQIVLVCSGVKAAVMRATASVAAIIYFFMDFLLTVEVAKARW
jgi:hypothetical protein